VSTGDWPIDPARRSAQLRDVRKWGALLAVAALTGCIPHGEPKPAPQPQPGEIDAKTRLCYARLSDAGIGFRPLRDQIFEGGCSALGAVQLIDLGTPVANLGAMTCPLAEAFAAWVRDAVQPAARAWLGSRIVKIESFGTYSCRPVNGQAGARLSEHGKANAVDVGAFLLADGRRITVAAGWNGTDEDVRRFLRAVHDSGCRRFSVGLGPDANAFHRDHLHFDLGPGPYCR
jgi:hypothetical protein